MGNKYDLEAERRVSELEIRQFCESMDCLYVRCSVLNDTGVEELINTIITKCIDLESQVVTSGKKSAKGENIFTLGGSDGLTTGDVKNINPMRLDVKKRNKRMCCVGGGSGGQ